MNFSLYFWFFFSSTHHETFELVSKASMTSFGSRPACFSPSPASRIVQFSSRAAWCSMSRPMVHHSTGGCLKRVGKKWNLLVFYVFCSAVRVSMLRPTHRIMQFECISQPSVILMRISESVLFSFNEWKEKKVSACPLRDLTSHLGNAAAVHPHPNTIQAGMSARDRDRRERERLGTKRRRWKVEKHVWNVYWIQ